MTASPSSRPARTTTTNTAAMGEQHTTESIARTPRPQPPPTPPLFNNLHEYFKPVFDELDNLNRMLDSFIEEEMINEKRKRNDDYSHDAMCVRDIDSYHRNSMTKAMEQNHLYF
jgi:hypothetical protein